MAKCIYCGEPAGWFRKRHAACYEQYQSSVRVIPQFFSKVLHSSLDPQRFSELLRNAAAASYVSDTEFSKLAVTGMQAMIETGLTDQILTPADEVRACEIAEAVGISLANVPELREKLVKIRLLRDLDAGQIPDRIQVSGPVPLELAQDEHILWIINNAKAYRTPRPKHADDPEWLGTAASSLLDYYSPPSTEAERLSLKGLSPEGATDVVFTNQNIFVISADRQRKIPAGRIVGLRAYANAIQLIQRRRRDDRPITISLDDPWFAANLAIRLIRLNQDVGEDSADGSEGEP